MVLLTILLDLDSHGPPPTPWMVYAIHRGGGLGLWTPGGIQCYTVTPTAVVCPLVYHVAP